MTLFQFADQVRGVLIAAGFTDGKEQMHGESIRSKIRKTADSIVSSGTWPGQYERAVHTVKTGYAGSNFRRSCPQGSHGIQPRILAKLFQLPGDLPGMSQQQATFLGMLPLDESLRVADIIEHSGQV